jgi:hypothetical protein
MQTQWWTSALQAAVTTGKIQLVQYLVAFCHEHYQNNNALSFNEAITSALLISAENNRFEIIRILLNDDHFNLDVSFIYCFLLGVFV